MPRGRRGTVTGEQANTKDKGGKKVVLGCGRCKRIDWNFFIVNRYEKLNFSSPKFSTVNIVG